ncbi:hypothetical protein, partial [Micrococcus yunnanensis]|uniref:hypothetical protein n=1 Tax=Micrococcus yunnanensis TaxID=566027 RepID=UPI0031D03873
GFQLLDQVLARGLAWVLLVDHGHDSYRSSRYGLHRPSDTPWTKAQLAAWGVPWLPPKGWRAELEEQWKALGRPFA